MVAPTSQSRGHDGSPILPPHHTGWIDVADMRARSPLAVSGAMHSLDGREVETPSTPHTIPIVGFERPLRLSLTV
jgi:hypothetical protein